MNAPNIENVVYEYRYSMPNVDREDTPYMSKLNLLRSKLPACSEHKSCIIDDSFGRAGAIIAIGLITYALSLMF